jgi:hypothetical protein
MTDRGVGFNPLNEITINQNERSTTKMRKITAFLFVALAFSLFGCKGPEGPTGPAGANGTNGTSAFWSIEGFKDSLQCGKCHTV